LRAKKAAGEKYVRFADQLDQPDKIEPMPQPAPKPPRATRPLKLSVTAIEDWLRDPYTIYAKYILRLSPLDPVDMPLSAADRGSAIHDALGEFTQTFATALPNNPALALRGIGEKYFAPLMERPEARALWWPRFQRIAAWFADWEIARRDHVSAIAAAVKFQFESTMSALLFCRRAPTGSNAAMTKRLPFSTIRPGNRRPASRCGWACRHSSRWKRLS